jgi:hypothetical protein
MFTLASAALSPAKLAEIIDASEGHGLFLFKSPEAS